MALKLDFRITLLSYAVAFLVIFILGSWLSCQKRGTSGEAGNRKRFQQEFKQMKWRSDFNQGLSDMKRRSGY